MRNSTVFWELEESLDLKRKQLELIRKRGITQDEEFRERYERIRPSIENMIRLQGVDETIRDSLYMNSQASYLGITLHQLKDLLRRNFPET